jgi:hypothetical protein
MIELVSIANPGNRPCKYVKKGAISMNSKVTDVLIVIAILLVMLGVLVNALGGPNSALF